MGFSKSTVVRGLGVEFSGRLVACYMENPKFNLQSLKRKSVFGFQSPTSLMLPSCPGSDIVCTRRQHSPPDLNSTHLVELFFLGNDIHSLQCTKTLQTSAILFNFIPESYFHRQQMPFAALLKTRLFPMK